MSVEDVEAKRAAENVLVKHSLGLALLSAGLMSLLSSTCHNVEGNDYRRFGVIHLVTFSSVHPFLGHVNLVQ